MQTFNQPPRETWPSLVERPAASYRQLEKPVKKILKQVREKGDRAVRKYTREFDGARLRKLEVTPGEMRQAVRALDPALRDAIVQAAHNIRTFHSGQMQGTEEIETMPGIRCWRRSVGIEKVGLYIPGGSAPLFSTVLMLGIPAMIAGCRDIVLCTPPQKDGTLHPAILFAAHEVGITRLFKAGGVQAIGAMAYGTESIPAVYKIFGPGNSYVTLAKQLVQQDGLSIDMPAGPSEVCVLADGSAEPAFIAADLLSQAEHGPDSQVLLVTTEAALLVRVQAELDAQLDRLPRKAMAAASLSHSRAVVFRDMDDAMDLVNAYAPEHLILCCREAGALAGKVVNAGSVFIGNYSPESVGDYASGTNHTLPTNGYARAYSGVSVDSFVRKITFQQLTKEGLDHISGTVVRMAEAEGLQAHAHAVTLRLLS
jgi:histidinol dehydrogenase